MKRPKKHQEENKKTGKDSLITTGTLHNNNLK